MEPGCSNESVLLRDYRESFAKSDWVQYFSGAQFGNLLKVLVQRPACSVCLRFERNWIQGSAFGRLHSGFLQA